MDKGLIAILLDETGSMSGQEARVTTGINEYISTLKSKAEGEAGAYKVMLNLFDSERWREYYHGPMDAFPPMTAKDYRPGAMTPLYDSLHKTIRKAESWSGEGKVLVIIDTDGMENASQEVSRDQIFKMVKDKESLGWTFVFLGADMEEFGGASEAQANMGLGLNAQNCMDMKHDNRSVVYSRAAKATHSYMDDESKVSDTNFWNRASS